MVPDTAKADTSSDDVRQGGTFTQKTLLPSVRKSAESKAEIGHGAKLAIIEESSPFLPSIGVQGRSVSNHSPQKDSVDREHQILQGVTIRAARARIRFKIGQKDHALLRDKLLAWKISGRQTRIDDFSKKFQKVFAPFIKSFTVNEAWTTWNNIHKKIVSSNIKLKTVQRRSYLSTVCVTFVRWQMLWVGCSDWRPAWRHRIFIKDFKKNHTSQEDMLRFLSSDKGKSWARSASQVENDVQFRDTIIALCLDIEALGKLSLEVLHDTTKVSSADAQGLFTKIQRCLQPDFERVAEILETNPFTQEVVNTYCFLIERFNEMITKGIHPLGTAINQNKHDSLDPEIAPQPVKISEYDDEERIRLDFCVRAADGSDVRSTTAFADNDKFVSTWSRGYQISYSDHQYGELKLEFIEVEIILPPSSRAYAFVINNAKFPGQLLHETLPVCGDSFLPLKYRFELKCNLSSGMAVMVHLLSGPSLPSKYTCWRRSFGAKRTVNSIISIRSVSCASNADFAESDLHVAMWLTIEERSGQEVLRKGWSYRNADTDTAVVGTDGKDNSMLSDSMAESTSDSPEGAKSRERFPSVLSDDPKPTAQTANSVVPEPEFAESEVSEEIFHAWRSWSADFRTDIPANIACAYNPKYGEIWICMPRPSTQIHTLQMQGKWKKSFDMPAKFPVCSLTIDAEGKLYACDGANIFYKILHERFWDPGIRREADRFSRLWLISAPPGSFPSSIAVPTTPSDTCYVLFLKGPIWALDVNNGGRRAQIPLHPPPASASCLVLASDSFVVGDGHTVKVYGLSGSILSVLGQCYCEPCLLWTGETLYVADRNSPLWDCYASGLAKGTELSQQREGALRAQKLWTVGARAVTPGSKSKVQRIAKQVEQAMDHAGRPLSRALGDSSSLANSQGLSCYNHVRNRYEFGRFFTVDDRDIRDEMSQLKDAYPLLPVDPGNLYRAF